MEGGSQRIQEPQRRRWRSWNVSDRKWILAKKNPKIASKIHKASIQLTISSLKHTNVIFVRDCVTFNRWNKPMWSAVVDARQCRWWRGQFSPGAPASLEAHPGQRGRDAAPSWQPPPLRLLHPHPCYVKRCHSDRRPALFFTHGVSLPPSRSDRRLCDGAGITAWGLPSRSSCVLGLCSFYCQYIFFKKPFYYSEVCSRYTQAEQVEATD